MDLKRKNKNLLRRRTADDFEVKAEKNPYLKYEIWDAKDDLLQIGGSGKKEPPDLASNDLVGEKSPRPPQFRPSRLKCAM